MSVLTYREIQKIRRNVRRTAKLLDKKYDKLLPNSEKPWFQEIALATLQFCNPGKCVLGQLFGTCIKGEYQLGIDGEDSFYKNGVGSSEYAQDCYLHGDTAINDAELEKMAEFWFEEILARRRVVT